MPPKPKQSPVFPYYLNPTSLTHNLSSLPLFLACNFFRLTLRIPPTFITAIRPYFPPLDPFLVSFHYTSPRNIDVLPPSASSPASPRPYFKHAFISVFGVKCSHPTTATATSARLLHKYLQLRLPFLRVICPQFPGPLPNVTSLKLKSCSHPL